MKKEIAGALLWIGTRTGIIRRKVDDERAAFEDGVVREANAEVIIGAIPNTGSKLSEKEITLRAQRGGGATVEDAALLARLERGDRPLTGDDIPLGRTRED